VRSFVVPHRHAPLSAKRNLAGGVSLQ